METPSLEFVGNATTVLRLGPFTLLTDPNFIHRGERVYLGKGLFSKRLQEPSLQPDQLPRLDAVVLSHLHGDHFDRVARRELDRDLPILTTPAASRKLEKWGFDAAQGLARWQSTTLAEDDWRLSITAAPGVHGPGIARHLMPPVMGSVLELTRGDQHLLRLYISGDTLCRPWLREVVERVGPLDAAVLHLGGTRALGLLVTMDGAQGADLVDLLSPAVTVPVHFDDYTVFTSPLSDFLDACARRTGATAVRTADRGETIALV